VLFTLVSLGISVPAQAQSPLADIRERINGILVQLRTFDNICVILLGAQIKEIDVDVLDARKLITSNKGNLGRSLLDALNSAEYQVDQLFDTLTQCRALLGTERVIDDGSIFAEANGVASDIDDLDGLDLRKEAKISGLLVNTILANLTSIGEKLFGESAGDPVPAMAKIIPRPIPLFFTDDFFISTGSAASVLLSAMIRCLAEAYFGTPGVACSEYASLVSSSSAELDVNESLTLTQDSKTVKLVPQLTERGAISFELLRLFKIGLGLVHQNSVRGQRILREITMLKKWAYKGLREVYNLLRASNFGGRAAGELLSSVTKVYTLNGTLVEIQSQALSTTRLSNGIYLALTQNRHVDGYVSTHMVKFVIAR
jgi:hypothetical protein